MRIRKTGRKIQKVLLTAVFLILLAGCLYLADRLHPPGRIRLCEETRSSTSAFGAAAK